MRIRNVVLMGAVLLFAIPAFAQEDGRSEVAIDFSYARWNSAQGIANPANFYGGGGSYAFYLTHFIGVKAEFTGYGSTKQTFTVPGGPPVSASGNLFTYLFGPVFKYREGKFQPFAQVLLGGAHSNVFANLSNLGVGSVSSSGNAFALVAGGGLDVKVTRSLALRVGEADYLLTRFTAFNTGSNRANQNSFRFQAGVVLDF